VFDIVHYADNDPRFDAEISALLKAVYVDAGFTPPAFAPKGFASEEIKKRGKIFLALDTKRSVIGMIIVGTYLNPFKQVATAEEAEMQLLGVLPSARGQGIAEALCRRFEAQALTDGLQKAVLSMQPMMAAAHKLYTKLGYERNPTRDWERNERQFWVYQKTL
jgi:ribosomal protein S18 acetylase RimI-like enzyme